MQKIKVILVDDHVVVRDGIKSLLLSDNEIEVISEASNYNSLKDILSITKPDIIIMDISLPDKNGIDITREIITDYKEIEVLILSMYTEEDFIVNAVKAGAKGYLPKNTTKEELLDAVKTICSGGEYFSSKISGILMKSLMKNSNVPEEKNLSKREKEILSLFAEGLSNAEIAEKLFISIRTVESHKNHIMQKLELKSGVEMVKYAIKNGMVEL